MISRVFLQRIFLVGILVIGVLLLSILVFRYQTINVLVPQVDIPSGTKVAAPMLRVETWPASGGFSGIVTDPAEIVGKTTQTVLSAGAPINVTALGDRAAVALDPRYPAMSEAEAGKMVVFIRSDLVRSSGNTVVPGERVSIVQVDPVSLKAEIVLQRVLVIAARSDTGGNLRLDKRIVSDGPAVIPAGYLLALDPANALKILATPSAQLTFVPVAVCSPLMPNIASEEDATQLAAAQLAAACPGTATGAPVAAPVASPGT